MLRSNFLEGKKNQVLTYFHDAERATSQSIQQIQVVSAAKWPAKGCLVHVAATAQCHRFNHRTFWPIKLPNTQSST